MIKTKLLEVTRPRGFIEKVPVKSLLVYLPSQQSSMHNSLDKFSVTDNSDIQYSYKDFKIELSPSLTIDTPTEVYLNQVNVAGSRSNASSFKIDDTHEDRLYVESFDSSVGEAGTLDTSDNDVNLLEKTITFDGSSAVYVSNGNNSISLIHASNTSHFIEHGQPLKYSNGDSNANSISNLVDGTTYYALNELSRIAFNQNSDGIANNIITTLHNKPHGLKIGDLIQYYDNGEDDIDLTNYQSYYVSAVLSTDTFQVDDAAADAAYSAGTTVSLTADGSSGIQYFYPTIKLGTNEESVLTYGVSPSVINIDNASGGTAHTLKIVIADYSKETNFNIAFSGISNGHDLSSTNIYRSITNRVETLLRSNALHKIEFNDSATNQPTSVFLAIDSSNPPNIKSMRKNFYLDSKFFSAHTEGEDYFSQISNNKIELLGEFPITATQYTALTLTNNYGDLSLEENEGSITYMYVNNSGGANITNLTNGKIYNVYDDGLGIKIFNFYGTNIYDRSVQDFPSIYSENGTFNAINMDATPTASAVSRSGHTLVACIPFIEGDRVTLYSLSLTASGLPNISNGIYDLENYYIQNIGTKDGAYNLGGGNSGTFKIPNSFNITRCILYDKNNNFNNYMLGKDSGNDRIRFRTSAKTTSDTQLAGYLGLRESQHISVYAAPTAAPGIEFFRPVNIPTTGSGVKITAFSSGASSISIGGGGNADIASGGHIVSGAGIPTGTLVDVPTGNPVTAFTMKDLDGTTGITTTASSSGIYTFIERGEAHADDGFGIYTTPDSDEQYFILGVDEFDIKNTTNNPKIKDKLILPNNKTGGINESPDDFGFINLSGKKYDYISTLQPKAIRELNCTLTTADGSSSIFMSPYGNTETDGTLGYMNSEDFYKGDISMEFIFIPESIANDVVFD